MEHVSTLLFAWRAGGLRLQWLATQYRGCWTWQKDEKACKMAALTGLIGTWSSSQRRNESPTDKWVVWANCKGNGPCCVLEGESQTYKRHIGRYEHEENCLVYERMKDLPSKWKPSGQIKTPGENIWIKIRQSGSKKQDTRGPNLTWFIWKTVSRYTAHRNYKHGKTDIRHFISSISICCSHEFQ